MAFLMFFVDTFILGQFIDKCINVLHINWVLMDHLQVY